MSLIIFESQVDLLNMPSPSAGGFYVGYDALTGILSQKDSNGVITQIGSNSSAVGSLLQTLAVDNHTGTYSIILDNGSIIKSGINGAQIKLDNGTPGTGIVNISTDGGVFSQSYLFMNPTGLTLKSLNKSLIFNSSVASFQFDTNNIISLSSNQYSVSLGGLKVLEFTNATSSTVGNRLPAIISSNGATLSSGIVNSVILGGISQNATQSNTVYVPDLFVQNGKVIKGTLGNGYLRFTNTNDAYLHDSSHIGLLSSTNTLTSNGISIRDTATASSTADVDTDITYISSKNSTNIAGLKNTVVVGGIGINATYSNTTYLGGTVSINGKYRMPQLDGIAGQTIQTDGFGNLVWGSGNIPSITIGTSSFSSLTTLANDATYKITNADIDLYGGTEIYLTTNAEGQLGEYGVGKFYNPKYNQAIDGYGIWDPSETYAIGTTVIWGGRVWTNVNGNVGTSIDHLELDSEWSIVNFNTTNYNVVYDYIKYDRTIDKILYRNESSTNIVDFDKTTLIDFGFSPIKVFQWGNTFDIYLEKGIGAQVIKNSYNNNINFRGAYQVEIDMDAYSYQDYITFDKLSAQSRLTFRNNSYQSGISLINSQQSFIEFYNSSYQESIVLDNSSQYYFSFNNSSQSTVDMLDSSQSSLTLDNSNQFQLSMNSLYQNNITLTSHSWNRSVDTMIDNEDGLTFVGGSLTTFLSNVKILGTSSVVNSTNTTISDSIIVLAASQSGTPMLDSGFFINRGSGATQGFIWDESAKEFSVIETEDTDDVIGNVNILNYSNFRAAGLTVSQIKITGSASNGYVLTSDATGLSYWGAPPVSGTPFILTGSSSDAFSNKTDSIYRTGALLIGTVSVDSNDRFIVSTNTGKTKLIVDNSGSIYNERTENTYFGRYAMTNTINGNYNTAFGYGVLGKNSNGVFNAAFGYCAMGENTTGYHNVAIGSESLRTNSTGYQNTALGSGTLTLNTIGYDNVSIGYQSMVHNESGSNNVAVGSLALQKNTTGNTNTALGYGALAFNLTGSGNVGIGQNSLVANISGEFNIGIGNVFSYMTQSSFNIGIGHQAMWLGVGDSNTLIGYQTLFSVESGSNNVSLGKHAGLSASDNKGLNESNNSIFIGVDSRSLISKSQNEIVIGYNAVGHGTNSVTLGNDSIEKTVLKGNVGIGTSSTPSKLTISGGTNYSLPVTASFSGEVVFFGTGTGLTAGQIYYFSSTGQWDPVSGTSSTIASSLLGIALGTTISSGMLTKGYANFNISHYNSMGISNKQYLSLTAGLFTETPPSSIGEVSRLIGYCVAPNTIYFCPDNTWLEIT